MATLLLLLCLLIAPSWAYAQNVNMGPAVIAAKSGSLYTATFQAVEDAEILPDTMTQEQYEALAEPNSAPPTPNTLDGGKTWVFLYASERDVYDTGSGQLEDWNLFLQNAAEWLLMIPNDLPLSLLVADYTVTPSPVSVAPDPPGLVITDDVVWAVPGGGYTP